MDKENILNNKVFKNLINVFVGVLIVFFVFSVINLADKGETGEIRETISITGYAEVSAKPDVAQITISVLSENRDLGIATEDNNTKTNAIVSFLKENGIEDKDIKTSNYNINPRYEYYSDYRNRYLAGYEVSQSLSVKIRNLDLVGEIIAGSSERGSNDISSLSFIIDDDEALKAQVKKQAIEDAKLKALELAKDLGISLSEIVGFYENNYYSTPQISYAKVAMNESLDLSSTPSIEAGENTITASITITYKIK